MIVCNGCGEPTDKLEPMCASCREEFNSFYGIPPDRFLTSEEILNLIESYGKAKQ